MGISAIPAAARYAALGAGAGTVGLLGTNAVASGGDGLLTKIGAAAAVSSAAAGAFLRSSMAREPHLRPWAAALTGLGVGGIGGIGFTAFENGAARVAQPRDRATT